MRPLLCRPEVDAKVEDNGGGLVLVEGLYSAALAAAVVAAGAEALGTNLGLSGAPANTT